MMIMAVFLWDATHTIVEMMVVGVRLWSILRLHPCNERPLLGQCRMQEGTYLTALPQAGMLSSEADVVAQGALIEGGNPIVTMTDPRLTNGTHLEVSNLDKLYRRLEESFSGAIVTMVLTSVRNAPRAVVLGLEVQSRVLQPMGTIEIRHLYDVVRGSRESEVAL
jgi:hypothetical protein